MTELRNKSADVLLIIPPFSVVKFPSLGIHILEACAKKAGFTVEVFYANLHLAAMLGEEYDQFCQFNINLLGERLFARSAHGDSVPLSIDNDIYNFESSYSSDSGDILAGSLPVGAPQPISVERLIELEEIIYNWTDDIVSQLSKQSYKVVGCSTKFEQNNASLSLLKGFKDKNPHILTILGGKNCDGDMAEGILSIDPEKKFLDYIFSGESEESFVKFLKDISIKQYPAMRIIYGTPCMDLNTIPVPDFTSFFDQVKLFLPELLENPDGIQLSYETSRGCWWGQKHQCLFCGFEDLNTFREKKPEKVLEELRDFKKYGIRNINMTDLIMPFTYFGDLLPRFKNEDFSYKFFYEQKATLNYKKLKTLKEAGITDVQPGVESLSDNLLKHLRKGTTLKHNLRTLRLAVALDLNIFWNHLWGFPEEKAKEYEQILELLPLICHLEPPEGLVHFRIVKFSPYFKQHSKYGIKEIKPWRSYEKAFPSYADKNKLAYYFDGDFRSECYDNRHVIRQFDEDLKKWFKRWDSPLTRPRLHLFRDGDNKFRLIDTRGLADCDMSYEISAGKAVNILKSCHLNNSEDQEWAITHKTAIAIGKDFVPLVTTESEIIESLDVE